MTFLAATRLVFITFTCTLYSLKTIVSAQLDQYALRQNMAASVLEISANWAVLGPFQIGTREVAWGSDPLEYYGGFPSLIPNKQDRYPSSIAPDGAVGWSNIEPKTITVQDRSANASLTVSFPQVDWAFLQLVYGWAATQYQAWARGEIVLTAESAQNVLFWTNHVVEFAVDGVRHFGGDFFAFRKSPLLLRLEPGRHVIDLRLVRDVRAMGGIGIPTIDVDIELRIPRTHLEVREGSILISDVVNGRFASPYASVSVTNTGTSPISIVGVKATNESLDIRTQLLQAEPITVVPGQTRPIPFLISRFDLPGVDASSIEFALGQRSSPDPSHSIRTTFSIELHRADILSPHKVTHLHPSGIVSYAVLRPPSRNATCSANEKMAPVLLQFHGAGVDADNFIVAHSLDSLPDLCAWVLFPTGVSPWSGDDWHTWGFSDVDAAVGAIHDWIKVNGWLAIGVDTNKWLVSGHSNGGQGSWYALTHRPDTIVAGAPVSGYLSIHGYVPYQLWRPMDPRKKGILEAASSSYRHELLASNIKGIPLYQQHGSADDNVPAYHSKLMHQLIAETGWSSNYSELPGKGHWWETVMTTKGLQDFYHQQLNDPKLPSLAGIESFEIVVADPGATGSKFGIQVLYIEDPGQLGKLRVTLNRNTGTWRFEPENIMAFEIDGSSAFDAITIHDINSAAPAEFAVQKSGPGVEFKRGKDYIWKQDDSRDPRVREPSQFGGLDALLKTKSRFTIAYSGLETSTVALQISRNLHQYYYADSEIVDSLTPRNATGHVITIAIGAQLPPSVVPEFPIKLSPRTDRLMILNSEGKWQTPGGSRRAMSAVFLRPLHGGRLELVVWGDSLDTVQQAARLVPMLTGTGQPDFIIIGDDGRWKGADAAYMGFFDVWWKVSRSSVLS